MKLISLIQQSKLKENKPELKEEGLEDLDTTLPVQINRFLDKVVNAIKGYKLNRKKEQLIVAKIVDALGMDKQELMLAIQKIKKKGIVQKEGKVVNNIDLDNYAADFQSYIEKKYKSKPVLMWKLDVDSMSGTFYWNNPKSEVSVVATPFWDGEETLPVDVQNTKTGDYISQKKYPLKVTGDMKKDEESYIKILKQVLSKVK